ncbi:MAG: RelA/SpoT family protein [Candidatus Paceibacterota bacterium]|jgi:GTP pyrophosphokinase
MLNVREIIDLMAQPKAADEKIITEALAFAEEAHRGQKRFSGEPYIIHPFEVAKNLAEMGADTDSIVAGLLHDTIEDCPTQKSDLEKKFGPTVAFLVDGVTKLGKLKYQGVERHAESLRKFFVASAEDIRVIMIRLADRLHNVRTLQHVPKEKQRRIAIETLDIYAPLASRLGMWRIKGALEDASFPYAYPKEYAKVVALRKTKGKESVKKLEKVYRDLSRELAKFKLKNFQIDYRIKYLYSLYEKLQRKDMNIEQIYDLSALRVIVENVSDCYQTLGIIHNLYRPVPNRLKDYIANPKPNGYQSIHTAVFTGDGSMVEIQIRTSAMHQEAEYGVASHIAYDESGKPKIGGKMTKNIEWIQELIEWQKNVAHHDEFLQTLKTDFFQSRIFVFTPKGEVVELPLGATALDFAYNIHSDIGDKAVGARINGKFSPLSHSLKNRDLVEIETKKSGRPNVKWLEFVKTSAARTHIKRYLQGERK